MERRPLLTSFCGIDMRTKLVLPTISGRRLIKVSVVASQNRHIGGALLAVRRQGNEVVNCLPDDASGSAGVEKLFQIGSTFNRKDSRGIKSLTPLPHPRNHVTAAELRAQSNAQSILSFQHHPFIHSHHGNISIGFFNARFQDADRDLPGR